MSSIVNGIYIENPLTKNAKGGTELMRDRFLSSINKDLLQGVAVHFSRVERIDTNLKQILYVHDLPGDGMYNEIMSDQYIQYIDKFVFVSYHQRDLFIQYYRLPHSKCSVIHNAIDVGNKLYKKSDKKPETFNFIYHTTPHRGLEILYEVIDKLSKSYSVHLDVYSSFKIYGWGQRDNQYLNLFENIKKHENMTYHGAVPNNEIIESLQKSHIFLFPSIWHETSCLALIEAIQTDNIVIHSDLGALPETSRNMTHMFEMTEDYNELANRAYKTASHVLNNYEVARDELNFKKQNYDFHYSLDRYAKEWNQLLESIF